MARIALAAGLAVSACLSSPAVRAAETLVTRAIPLPGGWRVGDYVTASGKIGRSDDVPPGAPAGAGSAEIAVDYSGGGFQFFNLQPAEGQVPGRCKRLRVWAKTLQPDYAWLVSFRDAEGREAIDGRKLEWGLRGEPNQWKELEFVVPDGGSGLRRLPRRSTTCRTYTARAASRARDT